MVFEATKKIMTSQERGRFHFFLQREKIRTEEKKKNLASRQRKLELGEKTERTLSEGGGSRGEKRVIIVVDEQQTSSWGLSKS